VYEFMKQVIVVNRALNLSAGKLAAQVAHAAVGAFLAATTDAQAMWIEAGMPKIVVYASDDDALRDLESAAQQRRIPVCLIRDEGRTVVPPETLTCIGIGPALATSIDSLTGALPLV
jgi:PTH2 family peptidyl-tRNA hydrolase